MRVSSLFIASLVCGLSGTAFLVGAAAESIENQCRMAVRAEMMGPNCRVANPNSSPPGAYHGNDPCYILADTKHVLYIDRVIECVKHGGPKKR
jgi:hypothetical protein